MPGPEGSNKVETSAKNEMASTAEALIGLDLQLRRHHYHSPGEESEPLDLIELGALLCTARVKRCAECPLRPVCATYRADARLAARSSSRA